MQYHSFLRNLPPLFIWTMWRLQKNLLASKKTMQREKDFKTLHQKKLHHLWTILLGLVHVTVTTLSNYTVK